MAATGLRPVIESMASLPGMSFSDCIGNYRTVRGTAEFTSRCKYAYWGQEFCIKSCDLQEGPHDTRNRALDTAAQTQIREHQGLLTDRLLATTPPPLDMIGTDWK